ncbi:MAG: discoidin domain-containing protein, partial [Oscillospiraceae bacterium]
MKTKTALHRIVSLVICLMMAVSLFPAEAVQAAQQALGRENLALNKTIVASGNDVDDGRFTPELMVDGKPLPVGPPTVVTTLVLYRLGEPTTFNRIKFSWQQRAVHFRLQASNDAENWQDIYTEFVEKENEKAQNTIDFEQPVTARYVKMQGIKREATWGYSIYEFEIYNIIKTELEKIMDSLKLEVGDADTVLQLPEKEGFQFEIFGSDNEQVIAPDGTITRPLSDMQVNIMIKGTDLHTGEEVYTEG